MAQLKVLFFINSLTWSYLLFFLTYLIIGKVLLPRERKAQFFRSLLSAN